MSEDVKWTSFRKSILENFVLEKCDGTVGSDRGSSTLLRSLAR